MKFSLRERKQYDCLDCGGPVLLGGGARRCIDCGNRRSDELKRARREAIKNGTHTPRARQRDAFRDNNKIAHALVARAISYSFLLPASELACTDCGEPATGYDHRDYNKPLDVEPVCTRCNNRRGPGIPMVLPTRKVTQ